MTKVNVISNKIDINVDDDISKMREEIHKSLLINTKSYYQVMGISEIETLELFLSDFTAKVRALFSISIVAPDNGELKKIIQAINHSVSSMFDFQKLILEKEKENRSKKTVN